MSVFLVEVGQITGLKMLKGSPRFNTHPVETNKKSLCLRTVESLQFEVKGDRGCLELTKISDYMDGDELEHTITYISVLTVCYNSTELTSKGHKRTHMENG